MDQFIDETTLDYPLYRWDIKRLNPNMSLPKPPAAPAGYALVHPTPQPEFDRITQTVKEVAPQKVNGKWEQVWETEALPPEQVAANIETAKANLMQAATDKRWDVMTGGMTLPNGVQVGTTIDDQNRITSVVANAELAGLTDESEVDFKAASGWVRITIGDVKQIAGAIGQFVQACYTAERMHHEAIGTLTTPEEVASYDVNAGWPQTEPET